MNYFELYIDNVFPRKAANIDKKMYAPSYLAEFDKFVINYDIIFPPDDIHLHIKLGNEHTFIPDFINCNNINRGLIISSKTKELFLNHCFLGEHRFYSVSIYWKNSVYTDYEWLVYTLLNDEDMIDFSRTEFISRRSFRDGTKCWQEEIIIFANNLADYLQKWGNKKSNEWINSKKVFFNDNFDKNLDIFSVGKIGFAPIAISERLKNLIEINQLTGCTIHPIKEWGGF